MLTNSEILEALNAREVSKELESQRIISYHLKGYQAIEIADLLGLNLVKVNKTIKEYCSKVIDANYTNKSLSIAVQLSKLSMLEKAAWEVYERSREREEVEEACASVDNTNLERDFQRISTYKKNRRKNRDGNVQALSLLLSLNQERSRLLSLYPDGKNTESKATVSELMEDLERLEKTQIREEMDDYNSFSKLFENVF